MFQETVRKALYDFRRTHRDEWSTHREKFRDDQLDVIDGILVTPATYYA